MNALQTQWKCVFNAFEMGFLIRVRCQQCGWNTPQPVQNASLLQVKCVCMGLKQVLWQTLTLLLRNSLFQFGQIEKNPDFSNFLRNRKFVELLEGQMSGNISFIKKDSQFWFISLRVSRNSFLEKSWVFCSHN